MGRRFNNRAIVKCNDQTPKMNDDKHERPNLISNSTLADLNTQSYETLSKHSYVLSVETSAIYF